MTRFWPTAEIHLPNTKILTYMGQCFIHVDTLLGHF